MRSVLDIVDLNVNELDDLLKTALDIIENKEKYQDACKHKVLATLFFEPSTRTRLSFESAMLELGGQVISVSSTSSSSASKGESVADTARVVSNYADIIAMRHPLDGAAYVLSKNATVPVINAGDGMHCHPTQTLADLLTIYRARKSFNNFTIGMCGDLKYGRTVHSLINALSRYTGVKVILISPKELSIPNYVKNDVLDKNHMEYQEVTSLEDAIPELDVLYMTRIQQERFDDKDEYERLKDSYILDTKKMALGKENMIVLHPLPRVNEISVKVDEDPRAKYFEQTFNGKIMRKALILKLINEAKVNPIKELRTFNSDSLVNVIKCKNHHCISSKEQELDQVFTVVDKEKRICRCLYCEGETTY